MDRRSFLRGLIAAPAIVTFGNLMPVRAIELVEHYGSNPDMHRALEAMRELNAMKLKWQAQWAETADFLMPSLSPQRYVRMIALTNYDIIEQH